MFDTLFEFLGIIALIGIIVFTNVQESDEECVYLMDVHPIKSLDVKDNLQGSFFLGIGGFGTETYYYYYEQLNESVILRKVSAESTKITETDNMLPSFVTYNCNCLTINCDGDGKDTLFVPKGTIKFNYDIKT